MYKYAATDSIFDGVSNIYLVSIATAFLAVIVAFYYSNFLQDEHDKPLKDVLNVMVDSNEEDNYVNDTDSELENLQDNKKNLMVNNDDYEDNDPFTNLKCNSASTHENSDTGEINIEGLVSKLKTKRIKDLEAQLTKDQLEEERRIEREQLATIFELLKKQEADLNMKEINESELNAQLALYR